VCLSVCLCSMSVSVLNRIHNTWQNQSTLSFSLPLSLSLSFSPSLYLSLSLSLSLSVSRTLSRSLSVFRSGSDLLPLSPSLSLSLSPPACYLHPCSATDSLSSDSSWCCSVLLLYCLHGCCVGG